MSRGRSTTLRDKHRNEVSKGHPPCHWCGEEIDYDADFRNPLAFQVDHVTPLNPKNPALRGAETLDNCVPSHRACNRAKSNKMPYENAGVTFVTDRCWWN